MYEFSKGTTTATAAAAAAKSLQSCPTPCDPIDSSPPGSPVPGILQARTLEWVAVSFSSRKTRDSLFVIFHKGFSVEQLTPVRQRHLHALIPGFYQPQETPILFR